jgi:SET domain-containing protein
MNRANAAVRTIRPIKKGEELLDNYGYHYAVTNKGDRQKSL